VALHFKRDEFTTRLARLAAAMQERKVDAVLLFAQDVMYWLTVTIHLAFCFFQSLVVKADGSMVLQTRSTDLRQASHSSIIDNMVIWADRDNANPAYDY
jgi:Xaa-Pro dipeptidase